MQKIISIAGVYCVMMPAIACTCGSLAGGGYYGILPQFHKNAAGLRWFHRSFETVALDESEIVSTETFTTLELWGRYYPVNRLQLLAFVPFNFSKREEGDTERKHGFGDASFSANYTLFNTSDHCEKKWRHLFLAGAGIKLPTGKYRIGDSKGMVNPYLQPGTGSVDFTFSSIYSVQYKKLGVQADAEYRINTKNKSDFKFGNRINSSLKLFYWQNAGKVSMLPNAGINWLSAAPDEEYGNVLTHTGGNELLATFGLDVYLWRFTCGFTYRHPAYQNIAGGGVTTRNQWLLNAAYLF
ncbi:MAG TPA: hypothetical protein VNJ07_06320 [Chitinophagales bacterium]|nr:hypothetical protein [Chitinophagales bacterium]